MLSGTLEFCHYNNRCASSAYELKENTATIKLSIPRECAAYGVEIVILDEALQREIMRVSGAWCEFSCGFDVYTFDISLNTLGVGLYFLRPEIHTFVGTLYVQKNNGSAGFSRTPPSADMYQLSISDFAYDEPSQMYGGIIYHVFVDRFARGDDAVIAEYSEHISGEWEHIPEYPEYPGAHLKNNTVYGGTLGGIADKLGYLKSLGVSAIYLSPIFLSVSNHKYDTADYMRVDPAFGGDAALMHLISECNKQNIRIILDGVFNHTGADSVYFNRYSRFDSLGAYQSKESPYYEWYDFHSHPDKYTSWWDIEILPRINPDLEKCRQFFVGDSGVISRYRDMGIYGFRLDVADELSDDFISRIKSVLSQKNESVLYGEVWEDASNKIAYGRRKSYYNGKELDGVMNYPLRTGIIDYITKRRTHSLRYAISEVMQNAPDRVMHAQMNLLGTHDTQRILTVLGGEPADGHTNAYLRDKRMSDDERELAVKRLKSAYTVLATLPGVPTVFYGDEAGLEGYSDPFNRMPYPWGHENSEILRHYREIGNIRRSNSVYARGGFRLILLDDDVFIFSRDDGEHSYVTVCNNSDRAISIDILCDLSAVIFGSSDTAFHIDPISASIYKVKNIKQIIIQEA